MNSTHIVEVVPVELLPHPNADSLSLVKVYDYVVCVRTADWVGRDRGAYLPPDTVVDITREEFKFLDKPRIKAKKLRGIASFGLLIPCDEPIGTDVTEKLGATHYVVPEHYPTNNGSYRRPPDFTKYDLDSLKRWNVFTPGENVVVTEKLDGENMRVTYDKGAFKVGSRSFWREYGEAFWVAFENSMLSEFLISHPGWIVYGEKLDKRYGFTKPTLFVFDVQDTEGRFHSLDILPPFVRTAPELYRGPFDKEEVFALAEGQSTVCKTTIREGVVVRPMTERWDSRCGRVKLKVVSCGYLEKA